MKCPMHLTLIKYQTNQLHPSQQHKLKTHIEACSKCKAELEFLKLMEMTFSDKQEIRIPEDGRDCCDEETLSAYLNRTLSKSKRSEVEVHFAQCDRCLSELAMLYDLVKSIEAEGVQTTPAWLLERARIPRSEPQKKSWWEGLFRPFELSGLRVAAAVATICLLIAIGGGILLINRGKIDTPELVQKPSKPVQSESKPSVGRKTEPTEPPTQNLAQTPKGSSKPSPPSPQPDFEHVPQYLAYVQGVELMKAEKYINARDLFKDVIDEFPNNAAANHMLGAAIYLQYNYNASVGDDISAAKSKSHLRLVPTFVSEFDRKLRGETSDTDKAKAAMLEEAMKAYKRAIEYNPEFDPAYEGLGLIALEQGKIDEAEIYFQRASEINGKWAAYQCDLGVIAYRQRQLPKAIEYYQTALKLQDSYLPALYNLGLVYQELGEKEKAIETFTKYLQIDREGIWAKRAQQHLVSLDGQTVEAKPTPKIREFANVHIGDTAEDVIDLYSEPSVVESVGENHELWRYPQLGINFLILQGKVMLITIHTAEAGAVADIKIGSTAAQVRERFGIPPKIEIESDGGSRWVYTGSGVSFVLHDETVVQIVIMGA